MNSTGTSSMTPSVYDLNLESLANQCRRLGQPAFRAKQIWHWLYAQNVQSWEEMKNLPTPFIDQMADTFALNPGRVVTVSGAADATRKLLVQLKDNECVEAVVIPAVNRLTVCISSQVGCKFACAFCASGQSGFTRDLSAGEIVAQYLLAWQAQGEKPSHVVLMGIGEPLDNYDQVIRAVRVLNNADGINVAARRITISTSGIVPEIQRLSEEGMQIELSVSLHAPNDDLRTKIMPVNRKYPLGQLVGACGKYASRTKRIITFEYTLIRDVNDRPVHARELIALLRPVHARVNLIPLSTVEEYLGQPSTPETMEAFAGILEEAGVNVTLRASRGSNLNAACGQLRACHRES